MSANRVFLVCSHHRELESALMLCERADAAALYELGSLKRAHEWFERHAKCGVDCFQLAYQRTPGWDVSPPAPPVASAVRVALLNGGES